MNESGVWRAIEGRVYLVGAGPGDPDLLTVRAHRLLSTARVVAHDELVSRAILDLVPVGAELIAVGRRRGTRPDAPPIHPLVLERALQGIEVVRLKGGDPLVFGRGGEEAERLAALGVPFEIVPGISAALGAAASTGIPLTHRDVAQSVSFATAHARSGDHEVGQHVPATGTVVLYMGLSTLRSAAADLVARGRAPTTPVAVVSHATLPTQRCIVGDLATIADAADDAGLAPPALVIVGEVVTKRVVPSVSVDATDGGARLAPSLADKDELGAPRSDVGASGRGRRLA